MNVNDEGIVKVIIRVRPLIGNELTYVPLSCVEISDNLITVYPPGTVSLTFSFDDVLPSISSQEEVYNSGPKEIIQSVMQGFNGTILTYGQMSSGKTYSMFGDQNDPDKMGIIPRMICTVFDYIDLAEEKIEFLIKVSFFDIYMEKIFDLLNPLGNDLKLKKGKKGVYIDNLREVFTTCDFDIHELIRVGLKNKINRDNLHPGRTNASHTIFSLTIQQTASEHICKIGKLYLVDLAGSEKIHSDTPTNADRQKSVYTSLTNLGIVINALAEKNNSFIPYRNSLLTRILQESLGGNSKTILIITCSPSPLNVEETLSSLRFATRVKAIKNYPIINREYSILELKHQFHQKLEQLQILNKKLKLLESQRQTYNRNKRLSLKTISVEEDIIKDSFDYTELMQEIEDIKSRIIEQEELKKKLEMEIESINFSIQELERINNTQQDVLQRLEHKSNQLDNELKEAENILESVLACVEPLDFENESINDKIEDIEKKLDVTLANIEHYKCQQKCLTDMRSSLSTAAVEEQLRRRIKEEKDKNKIIKEEMRRAQYEIDLLLFKKYKDYMEADNLQITGKKIFELELNIDKARMKYLEDEKNLNSLQRQAKIQRDALSITADKVTKDYRKLTYSYSETQLEKLIHQKKSARLEEKALKLAADIEKVEKKLSKLKTIQGNYSHIGELNKILSRANNMNSSLAARRLQYSIIGGSNIN